MIDRGQYYLNYYNCKKWIYKERYLRKKELDASNKLLFAPYGGEKEYYKRAYYKFCNYTPINER